jgi:hypothetical protein
MDDAASQAERLRQAQERLRLGAIRLQQQEERLRLSGERLAGGGGGESRTITVRVRDFTRAGFARIDMGLRRLQARVIGWSRTHTGAFGLVGRGLGRFVGLWRAGFARMGTSTDRSIRLISRGVNTLMNGMQTLARRSPLVAAALMLLGPVAQALSAVLTVALAGAFIGLGAYALRGNAQVKASFISMKTTVGAAVREAAAPMVPFLVGGMNQVAQAAVAMKPLLSQAFSAAGPLIKDLFGSITDLASSALPGMVSSLQASEPIMAGFRTAMGLVGQGIGDMFTTMTEGGGASALQDVWKTLGEELRNVFRVFGDVMGQMAKSGAATLLLVGVFRGLLLVVQTIAAAFQVLDTMSFGWLKKLSDAITGIKDLGTTGGTAATSLSGLRKQLSDVNAEIAKQEAAKNVDTSGIISPGAKKAVQQAAGYDESKYNGLLKTRTVLQEEVAKAAGKAAAANVKQAQSIQQVVDAMRAANTAALATLDAQAAFQQSIDDAAKGAKKLGGALQFNGTQLNLNNQKSRDAYTLLSTLAARTNDATKAMEDQKKPWSSILDTYKQGHKALYDLAHQMGANKDQAKALADQILKAPSKKVRLTADMSDLEAKIKKAKAHVASLPKKARTKVYAEIAAAAAKLAEIRAALTALDGKTATTYVNQQTRNSGYSGNSATGGKAAGGRISGPGTGTSDSIPLMVSDGEYVVNAKATHENLALLEDINSGKKRRGFAKGGLTSAMKSARSDMWSSLNISYWGKKAGRKNSSFFGAMSSPASLNDLVGVLNQWRGKIKAALSGSAEKRLLHSMDKTGKTLLKQEKALTKVNDALGKAKDKLASLKDAAAQLKDAVSSGINASGNITGGVVEGKNTTSAGLINNMTAKRDQATALASALKELKKRGLNKQSLSEIGQAGIDGGGLDTATALLNGSGGDIKTVNALQKQIGAAAKAAGKTTADAMYAAGIKAADGLVKGLTKQQKKIENIMVKAAHAFEKAIEKAIKHKANGGPVGAASGGPRSSWTLVGEQGPEMVRLPYGSSVSPNGKTRSMLSGRGGGGAQIIEVIVNLDGKVLGRQMVDPLRSEVYRLGGGSVQKALGRGTA